MRYKIITQIETEVTAFAKNCMKYNEQKDVQNILKRYRRLSPILERPCGVSGVIDNLISIGRNGDKEQRRKRE